MSLLEEKIFDYLFKAFLDYAKQYVIYFYTKAKGKILETKKTHKLSDVLSIRKKYLNGEIKKGDIIKCTAQFSKFSHIHVTKNFPLMLPYQLPEIKEPNRRLSYKVPHLPIGTVPPFDKDMGLGFLYRPVLEEFAKRNPFKKSFFNEEALLYIPILCPKKYLNKTESLINIKATVDSVPFEVMAEIMDISRQDYIDLNKQGKNIFLNATNPEKSRFEVIDNGKLNIKKLIGSLFCELHLEENMIEDDAFQVLSNVISDLAKKYFISWNNKYTFPVSIIQIGEKQTPNRESKKSLKERKISHQKVMEGLRICTEQKINPVLGLWLGDFRQVVLSYDPLHIMFQYPNFFSIYYTSDIYNNYFQDIKKFDTFVNHFINSIIRSKKIAYVDFLTDFQRQTVLKSEYTKSFINENPFLQNTYKWLQSFKNK